MTTAIVAIFCLLATHLALAEDISDQDLARLLASDETRKDALDKIAAAKISKIPILLSWTKVLPANVNAVELKIGMADAFRIHKTKEAIPFLIDNIHLTRWIMITNWLKTEKVLEEHLVAAAALIAIGRDASDDLMALYQRSAGPIDRLIAVFAISRIHDPRTLPFLASVSGEANLILSYASKGVKSLEQEPK